MFNKMSNELRFLCADMVERANSGHPGAPMGLAEIITALSQILVHNPKNPNWLNRDRVVFSGGHASSLVYAFLYLSGYDLSLEDLKNFRQLGSKTPGHPELETPGVEIATGPLGQGVANAVGLAMAAKKAANLLGQEIINHKVYCLCGDGDLEEGISYEACALAGHHRLDNLVIIYDSNRITIEGDTSVAWSENVKARFEAAGFEVAIINGHNEDEIKEALSAKKEKPYLIIANTIIAKGALELEGSHKAHGAPLGRELLERAKKEAGIDGEFKISDEVLFRFRSALERGDLANAKWDEQVSALSSDKKELLASLLNPDFSKISWPSFGDKIATRDSNHKILNAISSALPGFLGGSADLAPSNKTELNGAGDFPAGKNLHFGIREHAMGAITNAFARYGLFLPFCATFFVFSDYLKPAVRMSALMSLKNFFIWTHDSIGVGEDGPTHEPIEHLSSFRALPNLYVFRPASGDENVECWKKALELNAPSAFVLSRQSLAKLGSSVFGEVRNGAYLLNDEKNASLTLLATGSEVGICVEAAKILNAEGIKTNVASVPCFELFNEQSCEYKSRILQGKVLAVEAASGLEWYKYADEVLCMKSFGASGKAEELFAHFGFSADNVAKIAHELLAK